MSTSQYLPFAVGGGANALPYATYSALTTLIANGFLAGTAQSDQFNTLMRQVSVPAASLAQFAATYSGADVLDNGTLFVAQLVAAIQGVIAISPQGRVTGEVAGFLLPSAPPGWVALQGQNISRADNAALFALWGTTYGAGDGSTTFGVPDARADFLRGVDAGRGIDTGRVVGTEQDYTTAAPRTTTPTRINGAGSPIAYSNGATDPSAVGFARVSKSGENTTTQGTDATFAGTEMDVVNVTLGDAETRPRNLAVLWCVKN